MASMETTTTHHHALSDDLDPAEYKLVGQMYVGISEDVAEAYWPDHDALKVYFATDDWRDCVRWSRKTKSGHMTGNCVLCGSGFSHGVVYRHIPSGEHVAVGHICATNYLEWSNVDEKNRAKRQRIAKATRENRERREACAVTWAEYLTNNPALAAAVEACANHYVVKDIVWQVLEYRGVPTEGQENLILKIHRDELAKAAAADANDTNWIPVPADLFDGRHQITGTILSTKLKESKFGCQWKMTVRVDTDAGSFKLWGSIPSDLDATFDEVERRWTGAADSGDVVTFMARVDPAHWADDDSFGAFERPTKASFVERADNGDDA